MATTFIEGHLPDDADLSDLHISAQAYEGLNPWEREALVGRVHEVLGDLAGRIMTDKQADWVVIAASPEGAFLHSTGPLAQAHTDDQLWGMRVAQGFIPYQIFAETAA